MKIRPSDYENFDNLPPADKEKIMRAIAKRIRRAAAKQNTAQVGAGEKA